METPSKAEVGKIDTTRLGEEPTPWAEPLSRGGNPAQYQVLGETYFVLPTAKGYRETGVASWYGPGFHGNTTSNGEIYDMYAVSAAHKSLPIPTYARVTHLQNGKSLTVRINDRGPFAKNRIIDLSYAAAARLDMIQQGTALVEVEAIVVPPSDDSQASVLPPTAVQLPQPTPPTPQNHLTCSYRVAVQVGAFSNPENAKRFLEQLHTSGFNEALLLTQEDGSAAPHKVRIPLTQNSAVDDLDKLLDRLSQSGFVSTHIVTEKDQCDS
jgi:rare lipoprotein A